MFKELFLILKKDLSFHLTEEEKIIIDKMTESDYQNFKIMLLERIKCCELPLDVLEEYLEEEKEKEKIACFMELSSQDVSEMARIEAELDTKCSKLLIDIIKLINGEEEDKTLRTK